MRCFLGLAGLCSLGAQIVFKVTGDVVSGLRYVQAVYKMGVRVDKTAIMVGSYGPDAKPHEYVSKEVEEAPSGMLARGHYTVKSKFVDDDDTTYLQWEWSFDIKKDWQ
jgi:hypothetical protein